MRIILTMPGYFGTAVERDFYTASMTRYYLSDQKLFECVNRDANMAARTQVDRTQMQTIEAGREQFSECNVKRKSTALLVGWLDTEREPLTCYALPVKLITDCFGD